MNFDFCIIFIIVVLLLDVLYNQLCIKSEIKTLQLMIDECTDEIIKEMDK